MKKIIKYVLNHFSRPFVQRIVGFVMPVVGIFYIGRKVHCPVCGSRFRKFLPYGYVSVRANALCPRCLALERHRLLWLYLLRETDFFGSAQDVLHVAPERCFIRKFTNIHGDKYITADLESPLAKVKLDVQSMPFGDDSFDVLFCNHILEHVGDDHKAMQELFRVLRSGGWGIVLSPVNYGRAVTFEDSSVATADERRAAFGQPDHLRDYGRNFPDLLRSVGFRVEEVDYSRKVSDTMRSRFSLGGDIIYVVYKD